LDKPVVVTPLRSSINVRKTLVLDDLSDCFSPPLQSLSVLLQPYCFALVVHVCTAIAVGIAASDVATVTTVSALVYRLGVRLGVGWRFVASGALAGVAVCCL